MPKRQPSGTASEQDDNEVSRVTREKGETRRQNAPPELVERLREAKLDPLQAIHGAQRRIGMTKAEYDVALLNDVVVGYASAQRLAADQSAWKRFVNKPFWTNYEGHTPKLDGPSKHLKWVLLFIFEVGDDWGKARVNSYRRALEPSFEAKVDPQDVLALVQQHRGIEGLRLANLRAARSADEGKQPATRLEGPEEDDDGSGDPSEIGGDSVPKNDASDDHPSIMAEKESQLKASPAKAAKTPAQQERSDDASYWVDFVKRAKAIEASGRRPLLVAVDKKNFREATAVDRLRPTILEMRREQGEGWVHIVGVPYRQVND